jgi:hypothetical protein
MNLNDIASVLNYSAFRPEPDDPSAAWKRRFPGRRTLLFGLGKQTLTFRGTEKSGKPGRGDFHKDVKDFKDLLNTASAGMRDLSDGAWCAVSIHTRYVISLETNLSRRPGSEALIKSNPRTVLGGRYERGKKYSVIHNPETNSSILLTCDEEQLARIETSFKETGFRIGRICCGPYILLTHALSLVNATKGSEKPASAFILVLCEGAVCALVQDQDKWIELRSRTDVYDGEDVTAAIELVAPFQARIPADMPIVVVADTHIPGLIEQISQTFEGHSIQDCTQPDLLWNLIIQN